MAKTIFHNGEVTQQAVPFSLPLIRNYEIPPPLPADEPVDQVVTADEIPDFTGPSADDLRREAELFKSGWEAEKAEMIAAAQAEVDSIRTKAKEDAASESGALKADAERVLSEAQEKAVSITGAAQAKADALVKDAQAKQKELKNAAQTEGFAEGRRTGFEEGKQEADRLVERLHVILEKVFDQRETILAGTEQQVVDLVLLMVRKVVKAISESQEEVVKENVLEALRRVKSRCDVTVRVNMADAKLTTEHTKEFIQAAENVQNLTVLEDTSIDRGGCVVETDFGDIDARISSQLAELEKKIRDVSPVKSVPKR